MRIIYIGTAASEGLPSLFCQCRTCREARAHGGKEFRGRAGINVNEKLAIDFPPDIYHGARRAGVDLSKIEDIVLTHAHEDHFDAYELSTRRTPVYCVRDDDKKLTLHGTKRAGQIIDGYLPGAKDGSAENTPGLRFEYSPMYTPIKTASGVTVTPLPADHDRNQECRILLLEEDATGKRFLYAHDTGLFPDETLEFLRGKPCDLISFDCTNVMQSGEHGHMGLPADIKMKARLTEAGVCAEKTKLICHHFSHNGFTADGKYWSLDEFTYEAAKHGFITAYDGMSVEI